MPASGVKGPSSEMTEDAEEASTSWCRASTATRACMLSRCLRRSIWRSADARAASTWHDISLSSYVTLHLYVRLSCANSHGAIASSQTMRSCLSSPQGYGALQCTVMLPVVISWCRSPADGWQQCCATSGEGLDA